MKKQNTNLKSSTNCSNRRKFTLIELLIVIAIIGILASLLLPALRMAKELANGTVCIGNLKQMGLAASGYTNDFAGYFPPGNALLSGHDGFNVFQAYADYLGVSNSSGQASIVENCSDIGSAPTSDVLLCPNSKCRRSVVGNYAWNRYAQSWSKQDVAHRTMRSIPNPSGLLLESDSGCVWSLGYYCYVTSATHYSGFSYRHNISCNMLWADSHVSTTTPQIATTTGFRVPRSWMRQD